MPLIEEEHPVEALPAAAPYPALCMGIRLRRHQAGPDHPSGFRLEHQVSLGRELLVPIVDQNAELDALVLELPAEMRAC